MLLMTVCMIVLTDERVRGKVHEARKRGASLFCCLSANLDHRGEWLLYCSRQTVEVNAAIPQHDSFTALSHALTHQDRSRAAYEILYSVLPCLPGR